MGVTAWQKLTILAVVPATTARVSKKAPAVQSDAGMVKKRKQNQASSLGAALSRGVCSGKGGLGCHNGGSHAGPDGSQQDGGLERGIGTPSNELLRHEET